MCAASIGIERPGILLVAAVDDIGDGGHPPAIREANRQRPFQIDVGDQLSLAQIGQHLVPLVGGDAECHAAAGAAAIEAEHQAGACLACRGEPRNGRKASGDSRKSAPLLFRHS